MWPFKRKTRPRKQQRGYQGAKTHRLVSSWATAPTSADYDIRTGLSALRARSRELYQNNDTVKQFVRLAKTNVIGHRGIIVQSRVTRMDGQADEPARAAIEAEFKTWGRRGSADATGRRSWWQLQNDFIQSIAVDGEFLAIEETVRPYGYRLKVLDPELLPVGYNEDRANGNTIRAGIEYNPDGRPVAYWLKDAKRSAFESGYQNYGQYKRYAAERIIHEFLPEFSIQNRGVPWASVGMYRMGMLAGYEEAELVAARVASAAMGFFEQDPTEAPGDWTGDEVDEENEGDFTMEAEPGVFRTLAPGLKLSDWTPNRPTAVFKDFVSTCLRGFASGVGVSYSSLTNDYSGANYSSLRQSLLVEREIWSWLQTWAHESLHDRIFGNWLEAAILFGHLKIQGTEPRRPLKEYLPHDWQARRWQWVDPQKELNAIQMALALRVRSAPEVIREMGRDPDTVLNEITEWKAKLEAAGISESELVVAATDPNQPEDDDDA